MSENPDHVRTLEILADLLAVDPANLTPTMRLGDDLGADSLVLVELSMELEDWLGIEIRDADLEELRTIGDLLGLVDRKRAPAEV